MLRDPKPHSKYKNEHYRIIDQFDDKLKLNDNSWITREAFKKKFIKIKIRVSGQTDRLPLFEKYCANA